MSTDAPMSKEPTRVMHALEGLELPSATGTGKPVVVQAKCTRDDGKWMCISHRLIAANQLQLESHIDDEQQHLLVWLCHRHGPEVP